MRTIFEEQEETEPLILDKVGPLVKQLQSSEAEDSSVDKMAVPRRKLLRWIRVLILICVVIVVLVIVKVSVLRQTFPLLFTNKSTFRLGDMLTYDIAGHIITFHDSIFKKSLLIKSRGFLASLHAPDSSVCSEILELDQNSNQQTKQIKAGIDPFRDMVCLRWNNLADFTLKELDLKGSVCYKVNWTTAISSKSLENCFPLQSDHWYGGSLLSNLQWPLEDNSIPMQEFISVHNDELANFSVTKILGPVLEPLWLNSAGFGILVDDSVPLHISVNESGDKHLCLKSQYLGSRYKQINNNPLSLSYTVCKDRQTKLVHKHFMENFITQATSVPLETMLQDPLWSTRGINQENLTQFQVLKFQQSIVEHKLPYSQLHIAGNFTDTIGSIRFDFARFPNSHQMIGEIAQEGFAVSISVLPVFEMGSRDYLKGIKENLLVSMPPSMTQSDDNMKTNNKILVPVDFTNPKAMAWMIQQLVDLKKEVPITRFFFEGGEATTLPRDSGTYESLSDPNKYSTLYATLAKTFGESTIIGVGYKTQNLGLMVDLGARASSWEYDQGLKSLIPSVLTLGLLGYPFLLVGPVGGITSIFNRTSNAHMVPERELYIRWLQVSAFLPAMEISVGPWAYDQQVQTIAYKLLQMRRDIVVPVLLTSAREYLVTGAPLIRPLWWLAAEDETAQRIDCEFIVGKKLLVAPVLYAGARERDVYLPKVGSIKWRDGLRGEVYTGGQWLRGYKVNIDEIATFTAE